MCSNTPRFSYGAPETTVRRCAPGTGSVASAVYGRWVPGLGIQGGYTGWVAGGLYRGYYPAARGEVLRQRSGPGRPCRGLEWWSQELGRTRGRRRSQNPPFGPGQDHAGPSLVLGPDCRLTAKGATFDLILHKVSQNDEVSPKSVHEASHSPYSQNGLRKSPLGFLRFPLLLAFSGKELMGLF